MSIQQDKRVVKPSKMSERYARWFETRVPSTSRLFRYIVMFLLSVPISILSFFLNRIVVDTLFIILFAFGTGVVLYLLYLKLIQRRFQSPITDQQFSQIVQAANERIVTWRKVNVWPRKSPEPYIASTFNALFDAVIVSDTMIDLIKTMPQSGEALLAFHLLRAPKRRNVADLVFAIIPFFLMTSYFPAIFTIAMINPYYYFPILFLYSPFLFLTPVILLIAVRGAFWTHDSAFERTSSVYQIHPQVAKDEVMSSQKLDDEAVKSTIWVVREWERRKRNGRRSSIIVWVIMFGYSFILVVLLNILTLMYYMYTSYYLYVIVAIIPLIIAFVVYLLLKRWDKRCMGEIYYKTTQADEPIWVD